MFVCKTLDCIINGDLHRSLDQKLMYAKSKGVEVEIELTELIGDTIIDTSEVIKMLDQIIDDALVLMNGIDNKKMLFCSFYKDNELWIVIRYNAVMTIPLHNMNEELSKILNNHLNIISDMTYEEPWVTQKLIIYKKSSRRG